MARRTKLGFSPQAALERITGRLRPLEVLAEPLNTPERASLETCSPLGLAFGHLGRHGSPLKGCAGCGMALAIKEIVLEEADQIARPYVSAFVRAVDEGLVALEKLGEAFQEYREAAKTHAERTKHPILSGATLWRGFFMSFEDVLRLTHRFFLRARAQAERDLLGVAPPSAKTRGRPPQVLRDAVHEALAFGGLNDRQIADLLAVEKGQSPPKEVVRKARQRRQRRGKK